MSLLGTWTNTIRLGGAAPLPVDWALALGTLATRIGMRRRLARPRYKSDAYTISFGNLSAGGTGKTPAVIARALEEVAKGRRVAVLTRGYGAKPGLFPVVSRDVDPNEWVDRLGDEAALLLKKVPEAIVVRDPDRVAGARFATQELDCDCLLLDDGYQSVQLERDEDHLLIDAANPFGNGHLVPRGILREYPEAMARATHVVLTHCDHAVNLAKLEARVHAVSPETPVLRTVHKPVAFRRLLDDTRQPLEFVRGKAVNAACAIGQPELFVATLESLGAQVNHVFAERDHTPLDFEGFPENIPTVVTEKDAVKGKSFPDGVYALEIELSPFEPE